VHVARLAGVPRPVLLRAQEVLKALEARARGLDPLGDELPLFARPAAPAPVAHPVLDALAGLDADALSPREALDALYRLQALLREAVAPAQE
jgi:DNA mismatch repair protein MutS